MPTKEELKQRLIENAKDRIFSFTLDNGNFRGAVVHATRLVKDIVERHETGLFETLILGHACMGSTLMATGLKGNNRLKFHIECSGPVKGLVAEANSYGDVRGYLFRNPIPFEEVPQSLDTSKIFNAGFLTVTYLKEDAKTPYSGKVMLEHGEIAKEIVNYYLQSEQIPSACNLSVHFSPDGEVLGAGGILIQKMPSADDVNLEKVEQAFLSIPSIGEEFSKGCGPEDIINGYLKELQPKILANKRVGFACGCEEKRMLSYIKGLGKQTLKEILDDDVFPLEVTCHYCSQKYGFDKSQVQEAFDQSK